MSLYLITYNIEYGCGYKLIIARSEEEAKEIEKNSHAPTSYLAGRTFEITELNLSKYSSPAIVAQDWYAE